jgi:hypothetical protein
MTVMLRKDTEAASVEAGSIAGVDCDGNRDCLSRSHLTSEPTTLARSPPTFVTPIPYTLSPPPPWYESA